MSDRQHWVIGFIHGRREAVTRVSVDADSVATADDRHRIAASIVDRLGGARLLSIASFTDEHHAADFVARCVSGGARLFTN